MSKKIIVIEDNHDILDMISYILEDEGYQVVPSVNSEPLNDVEQLKPDLVLLDDWLPDGYGHDLCAKLKSNPLTSHIPVILVSSVRNLPTIALNCNADDYLPKPFDITDLIDKVKLHLIAKTTGSQRLN